MMKVFALFCALYGLTSCHVLNEKAGLKDDNKIEQGLEELIEEKTGVLVDFTPEKSQKDPKIPLENNPSEGKK